MKLFDILFGKAIDRRIAAYQNDLITKHCDEVDNIYRQMRGWRHDYHNHIQAMLAMTDSPEELRGEMINASRKILSLYGGQDGSAKTETGQDHGAGLSFGK